MSQAGPQNEVGSAPGWIVGPPRRAYPFADRKATLVVIALRVMIRHAERDCYYKITFAERKATMVVTTRRVTATIKPLSRRERRLRILRSHLAVP
jgi:hypothetical protein